MINVYVTMISLQSKKGLEKVVYQPQHFDIKNNMETSFPIIPIISNTYTPGDDVYIIAIRSDNQDTKDNYENFCKEVHALEIPKQCIKELLFKEDQSRETGLAMLTDLLNAIPEDSLVYSDITFGTKPMSALVVYAMNLVEKIKDSEVRGIFYGEITRRDDLVVKSNLYDLTTYKYLSDLIQDLRELEINDILGSLNKLAGGVPDNTQA